MTREVYTLDLSTREHRHVEPSCARDVMDICAVGLLALLGYVIMLLVLP